MHITKHQKPAFTLIEILIVISIIAILATLAIGNYNNIRSKIENQFTIDTLVQEFRNQSKLSQNQNQPTCHSIQIKTEENSIIKTTAPFQASSRTCQETNDNNTINLLENSQLKIISITMDNIESKEQTITFTPPSGLPQNLTNKNNLKIQFNTETEPENLKTILINLRNGSIQKL